jgi:hypothetical protein
MDIVYLKDSYIAFISRETVESGEQNMSIGKVSIRSVSFTDQ